MKIVDKKPCECTFGKLKQGDVFKDEYGVAYFMKIEPCYDESGHINFVTLEDGILGGWFEDDKVITKVNCELVIKNN